MIHGPVSPNATMFSGLVSLSHLSIALPVLALWRKHSDNSICSMRTPCVLSDGGCTTPPLRSPGASVRSRSTAEAGSITRIRGEQARTSLPGNQMFTLSFNIREDF